MYSGIIHACDKTNVVLYMLVIKLMYLKRLDLLKCCQQLNNPKFWEIEDLNQQNLDKFYREPAHVFLEMVSIL